MSLTCECGYTSRKHNVLRHQVSCHIRRDIHIEELTAKYAVREQQLALENAKLREELEEYKSKELTWKRARVRQNISAQTKLRLVMRQNNKCNMCDAPLKENHWDVDHVVPWAESLDNSDENLQILCLPCHRTKSTTQIKARKS